jgi:hypothetical protein
MINQVSDFIVPYLVSGWGIALFIIICSVTIIGQYFILSFVKQKSKEINAKNEYLKIIYRTLFVAQYALIAIIMIVVFEIITNSQYHTITLTATLAVTHILNIGIVGLFAQRFFSWYKSNRNSIVVLLYGLSFALLAIANTLFLINNLPHLIQKESIITPQSRVFFPSDFFEPGSILESIFLSIQYMDAVLIGLLVFATAILLRHYSAKLGRLKFWIIVSLPLLYKFSTVLQDFGLVVPSTDSEFFYWYLYASLNATAGGILFGFAFRTVSKTIRQDSPVRDYMIIAAYGFVLMFTSNQVTLVATSYPPFGLATMSFLALATYMVFLGVYSTAISVSQDTKLRQSIKKIIIKDTNLLSSIGTAHMEQEIQKTVNSMKGIVQEQEKELEEQTGIEANLEEDEMKNYLEEVMQEVGKAKKPPST